MELLQSPVKSILKAGVQVVQNGNVYQDANWTSAGVTAQFIDDADSYHEHYFNRVDFLELVGRMLTCGQVDLTRSLRVLDIGSGGGSSVFAALKLLPNSHVVASDISPQLLAKLVAIAATQESMRNRVSTYCFDLHVPFFEVGTFDIVLGCAILHHLVDPHQALKHVIEALKPGGKIIMVEPLEAGSLFNCFVYDTIIEIERKQGTAEDGPLIQLLRALRNDIQHRQGPPNCKPWTEHLDDKWVFNTAYLSDLAKSLGCKHSEVFPAQSEMANLFEGSLKDLLVVSGNANVKLSDAAVAFLKEVDQGLSTNLKQRLCPTGIIVFTK